MYPGAQLRTLAVASTRLPKRISVGADVAFQGDSS